MKQCHLTVVKGGAGSGKTTLLTAYIREAGMEPVVWFSLAAGMDNPLLFWSDIITALTGVMVTDEQSFADYFETNADMENLPQLLAMFCDGLPEQQDIYVVLDDFHLIEHEDILWQMEFFIANTTSNIHIVLLSRREPQIYLGSLAMEGGLLLVEEQELRLTDAEALCFLRQTLALPFDEATLGIMAEHAEGWVGGLQLIAAGAYGKPQEEIGKLRLSGYMVNEYITREIFDVLNPGQQDFLIGTAPLTYFGREICAGIFEDCDFTGMLESFERQSLLLQCLDEGQQLYRYHHILGEYLGQRFERLPEDTRKSIRRKAAKAFEHVGDYEEALRHYFVLQDWLNAMRLLLVMPQVSSTFARIREVPIEAAVQNVDFAYQKFFVHYSHVDYEGCRELYQAMEREGFSDERHAAFRDLRFMFSYNAADMQEELPNASDVKRLPLSDVSKVLILIKSASYLQYQGHYREALRCFEEAAAYPQAVENNYMHFFLLNVKSQVLEEMGHFRQALHLYEMMESLLVQNKGLRSLWPSYHISITGVLLKQLRLEEAGNHLEQAVGCSAEAGEWFGPSYDYNYAECLFLGGREDEAVQIIERLMAERSSANMLTMPGLLKYLLRAGAMPSDIADLFRCEFRKGTGLAHNLESRMINVRLLFQNGDIKEAVVKLDHLLAYARKEKFHYRIVEGALIKVRLLLEDKAREREVKNLCLEALHYAAAEDILAPFVLEKDLVAVMAKRLVSVKMEKQEADFLKRVKKLCGYTEDSLLSKREEEVLHLLADGAANKQIAEELCISPATVKTHILNIYGKLQVNSRVSAVEAARRSGILK